jgi:hypothetical protein
MWGSREQFDPESFDYERKASRLKRQQALAQQLMSTQQPGGQMVSGWYVAPNMTSRLSSTLQNVLGAWMANKGDKKQSQLDDESRQALAYHLTKGPQQEEIWTTEASGGQGEAVTNPETGEVELPEVEISSTRRKTTPVANQLSYFERLAKTGPMGQQIANQGVSAMFAKPGSDWDVKVNENGTIVRYNKVTGQVDTLGGSGMPNLKPGDQLDIVKNAYSAVKTQDDLVSCPRCNFP